MVLMFGSWAGRFLPRLDSSDRKLSRHPRIHANPRTKELQTRQRLNHT
jgi:hypothetical protein